MASRCSPSTAPTGRRSPRRLPTRTPDTRRQPRHQPSEALQRLQRGILAHDPALEIPTGVGARNGQAAQPLPPSIFSGAGQTEPPPRPNRAAIPPETPAHRPGHAPGARARRRADGAHDPSERHRALRHRSRPTASSKLDPATGKVVRDVPVGSSPGRSPPRRALSDRQPQRPNRVAVSTCVRTTCTRSESPRPRSTSRPTRQQRLGLEQEADCHLDSAQRIRHRDVSNSSPVEDRRRASPRGRRRSCRCRLSLGHRRAGDLGEQQRSRLADRRAQPPPRFPDAAGRATSAIAFGYGSAWIGTYDRSASSAWITRVRAGSDPESVGIEAGDG